MKLTTRLHTSPWVCGLREDEVRCKSAATDAVKPAEQRLSGALEALWRAAIYKNGCSRASGHHVRMKGNICCIKLFPLIDQHVPKLGPWLSLLAADDKTRLLTRLMLTLLTAVVGDTVSHSQSHMWSKTKGGNQSSIQNNNWPKIARTDTISFTTFIYLFI